MINQCVLEKHVTWPTVAKGLFAFWKGTTNFTNHGTPIGQIQCRVSQILLVTSVNGWCSCFLRCFRPPTSKNFATWVSKWVVPRRIVEDNRELQWKTIHPCWYNERVQALIKTEHCILLQISMTPIRSVSIVHYRLPMYFEIITEKRHSVL